MITIAQQLIDLGPDHVYPESAGKTKVLRSIQSSLWLPKACVLEAKVIAEKFVFDIDPGKTVIGLIDTGQVDSEVVFNTAQLVANPMWMEWRMTGEHNDHLEVGVLLTNLQNKTLMLFAARTEAGHVAPFLAVSVPQLPTEQGHLDTTIDVHWGWFMGGKSDLTVDDRDREIKICVLDVFDALFLLCIPRAYNLVESKAPRAERRRRERDGGPPLIEWRDVKLKIGEPRARYQFDKSTMSDAEYTRRKLHRVLGHLRVYRKNREEPHVTFVEEHWRGDEREGIVLHNRTVKS